MPGQAIAHDSTNISAKPFLRLKTPHIRSAIQGPRSLVQPSPRMFRSQPQRGCSLKRKVGVQGSILSEGGKTGTTATRLGRAPRAWMKMLLQKPSMTKSALSKAVFQFRQDVFKVRSNDAKRTRV
jgi:hypothetical protein